MFHKLLNLDLLIDHFIKTIFSLNSPKLKKIQYLGFDIFNYNNLQQNDLIALSSRLRKSYMVKPTLTYVAL